MWTATGEGGSGVVMELLRSGISPTLLWDLVDPKGPDSHELYVKELACA